MSFMKLSMANVFLFSRCLTKPSPSLNFFFLMKIYSIKWFNEIMLVKINQLIKQNIILILHYFLI